MKKISFILLVCVMISGIAFAGGSQAGSQAGRPITLTAYCPSNINSVPTKALLLVLEVKSLGQLLLL